MTDLAVLSPDFSNVRVVPALSMVSTEAVVVLMIACTDLRLVRKQRELW